MYIFPLPTLQSFARLPLSAVPSTHDPNICLYVPWKLVPLRGVVPYHNIMNTVLPLPTAVEDNRRAFSLPRHRILHGLVSPYYRLTSYRRQEAMFPVTSKSLPVLGKRQVNSRPTQYQIFDCCVYPRHDRNFSHHMWNVKQNYH